MRMATLGLWPWPPLRPSSSDAFRWEAVDAQCLLHGKAKTGQYGRIPVGRRNTDPWG